MPSLSELLESIQRRYEIGKERIQSFKKPLKLANEKLKEDQEFRKKILDPQEPFLVQWNKIFVLSCVIAMAMDPLFFYIPVIDAQQKCLTLDEHLQFSACILRTLIDIFYLIHIILQFHTGYFIPSSQVFGRGELVQDPKAIARRYLSSYFIIDVLSILPMPQLVVLIIIPAIKGPPPLMTKELLKYVILAQYVPRIFRIYPLYVEITRSSGILTETAWGGAVFNLLLIMLCSHIVGAGWYLLSIEREVRCWQDQCENWNITDYTGLYCQGLHRKMSYPFLNDSCPHKEPEDNDNADSFDFGIFRDALKSGVVESIDFRKKFAYCFWWGLRGVSSLGQNLQTSTFVGEIVFAVFISICGLVLFSLLIGNMQKYLQSTTMRVEEMRVKRRDSEHWMSHRMLPEKLRDRVRRYNQYKWQQTRGVDEEQLIGNLPQDLRKDIKRHLCLTLLTKVQMFISMDEQLLDAMCDCLKPVLYTAKSTIIRQGDPVHVMLFIMRGNLAASTTYGRKTGVSNASDLKDGDFCGEELLNWALDPHSPSYLPNSSMTIQSLTEVEAFALMAEDLKNVASQYRHIHSSQLQHTFRFYSLQWRTWAALIIQVAWHRYLRRKMEKSLNEAEDRLQKAMTNNVGTSTSPAATVYASRFAANLLLAWQRRGQQKTTSSVVAMPLPPKKPPEPDFTK